MKFRFLNKTIENQRYNYTPMYYDQRKERLNRKKKEYAKLKDENLTDSERTEIFKNNLREGWSRAEYRSSQQKSSNIRVVILIVLIVALGYFIFNGVDEVDTVVTKLW